MKYITKNNNVVIQLLSGRSNVFALKHHSGRKLMVDTSVKIARKFLEWAMEKQGLTDPEYLILTHCHFDHAGNASFIKTKTGAKIAIHKNEAANLRSGGMEIPEGTNVVTEKLVDFARKINFTLTSEPCEPDIEMDESLTLSGFDGIEIIHTPGHSNGSVTIIIDNEIAIVGDTMINVPLFRVFPPFAEDIMLLKISWEKLLTTQCTTFLPSHGNALNRNELTGALWELESKMKAK